MPLPQRASTSTFDRPNREFDRQIHSKAITPPCRAIGHRRSPFAVRSQLPTRSLPAVSHRRQPLCPARPREMQSDLNRIREREARQRKPPPGNNGNLGRHKGVAFGGRSRVLGCLGNAPGIHSWSAKTFRLKVGEQTARDITPTEELLYVR